jgi:cobalt-zinc-cadmium efflux system membrane fusion protein
MRSAPNSRSVLVVDDDEVIGNVLSRVLERDGYTVNRATSPDSALDVTKDASPDVALVDLCFPNGDGLELADHLRSRYANLPLILMTAYPLRLRERPELGRVFDSILHKPINLEELRRALDAALASPGLRDSPPPARPANRPKATEGHMETSTHASDDSHATAAENSHSHSPVTPLTPQPEKTPLDRLRALAGAAVVLAAIAGFAVFVLRVPLPWVARANADGSSPPREPAANDALASVQLVDGMPHTLIVPESVRKSLGIRKGQTELLAVAQVPTRTRAMVLPGSTALDPARLDRIRARFAPARATEIAKVTDVAATQETGKTVFRELTTGDHVRKDDLLAVVYSPDVGNKKNDLIDALYQLKLDEQALRLAEKAQAENGALPEIYMITAKRAVEGDRNTIARTISNLRTWDIPEEDIQAVMKEAEEIGKRGGQRDRTKDDLWPRVELRAPAAGIIVERNITEKEMIVDATVNMFQIAKVNRLTVLVNCPEDDVPTIQALRGKQREWTINTVGAKGNKEITAPITEIGYLIDPNQHTAVLKGYIDNPGESIRAGQFITATIQLPPPADVVEVPVDAVVEDGQQCVVFVQRDAAKQQYTMRRVELTHRFDRTVFVRSKPFAKEEQPSAEEMELGMYIKEPLKPGERILQTGVGELKAALLDKESEPKKEREDRK